MRICITFGGKKHCFNIPLLVDSSVIKRPPPNNIPQLELAATVLEMVRVVGPSELSKKLTEVASGYIANLKTQLPKGVEIHTAE